MRTYMAEVIHLLYSCSYGMRHDVIADVVIHNARGNSQLTTLPVHVAILFFHLRQLIFRSHSLVHTRTPGVHLPGR